MEWQPIETAPKDGTWILLGKAGEKTRIAPRFLVIASSPNKMFFEDDLGHQIVDSWPTHWMPLPDAPEDQPHD